MFKGNIGISIILSITMHANANVNVKIVQTFDVNNLDEFYIYYHQFVKILLIRQAQI